MLAALPDPVGGLRFDFGSETSPVADGFLQVANTMLYDAARGYGLDRATTFRDRGTADPLLRDFTNGAAYSFAVDLPAGDYYVTIYSGDAIASNRTTVEAEGVSLGTISTAVGAFGPLTRVLSVTDGQLNLSFGRDGRVNGIVIVPIATPTGLHVGDLNPARPGLEVFGVHERTDAAYGYEMRDAATGEVGWGVFTGRDTGRGAAADIDPRHLGAEAWAVDGEFNSATGGVHTATGELISTAIPAANFVIWWDGDLQREILDHDWSPEAQVGVGTIGKWDPVQSRTVNLLTATGTLANNGTKGNPGLQADLLGDWREEAIWRTRDSSALRVYATPHPSPYRFTTLMHDAQYRLAIAWQNVGYNQPPHPSFNFGSGMSAPTRPHIGTGPAPNVVVPHGVADRHVGCRGLWAASQWARGFGGSRRYYPARYDRRSRLRCAVLRARDCRDDGSVA